MLNVSKYLSVFGLLILTAHAVTPQRQAPGSPKFDCHSDCGSTIAGARVEGHCSNSTWIDLYGDCLDCAVEQNIWSMYGRSVGAAGQACGLSTTPEPAETDRGQVSSNTATPSTTAVAGPPTQTDTSSPTASGSGSDAVESVIPTTPSVTSAAPGRMSTLSRVAVAGLVVARLLYGDA
ncbi:hypothetical protein V8F20_010950 [Naviculisporaceae sp. PSN 640]